MAQRATSLGPKPSLFYLFFFVFASARKKPLFSPLKRAFLCTFSVSPFVSL